MRLRVITGVGVVAVAAIVSGCGSEPATQVKAAGTAADAAKKQQEDRAAKAKAAARVKANELGQIPVLMYHRIIDKPQTTDDRTPAQFRAELERLAKENYVPITAAELVTGMGAEERRRWEATAAVALMVDAIACGREISPAQMQREDIAEPLAAVAPPPDRAQ